MDTSSPYPLAAGAAPILVDVIRRYASPYLDDQGLHHALQSIDFSYISQLLLRIASVPDDLPQMLLLEEFFKNKRALDFGPNPQFDEAFYLLEYPDVSAIVDAGHIHCGFFHYIKCGLREGRWPNRTLKQMGIANRTARPLIKELDETVYLELNPIAASFVASFPFLTASEHYEVLGRRLQLSAVDKTKDLRINRLNVIYAVIENKFDEDFYRKNYLTDAENNVPDPFLHYFENAGKHRHSPNSWFDEDFYCSFYPDVGLAVDAGELISGFFHYMVSGHTEQRIPAFDLKRTLEARMPGVTTPTLLNRLSDIQERARPLGVRSIFRRIGKRSGPPRVWFVMPTLNPDISFGGYRAAFELIIALRENGYDVAILCTGDTISEKRYFLFREKSHRLRQAFEAIKVYTRQSIQGEEIADEDIAISYSAWDLSIASELASMTKRALPYLLAQEYEPIFYDSSSLRALCECKYDIPHIPIVNSKMLERYMRRHCIGAFSEDGTAKNVPHFVFEHKINVLPSSTNPQLRRSEGRLLAIYARPEGHAARNLFEMTVMALQKACEEGLFGPEWRFIGLGALTEISPITLGRGHKLHLHQKMSEDEYVASMRGLDIGLSLMYAPHPSVVPFEFATTGALVVTNVYENRSSDELKRICGNFIPCDLSIESIVYAFREAILRVEDLPVRSKNRFEPSHKSWDEIFSKKFIESVFGTRVLSAGSGGRTHRSAASRVQTQSSTPKRTSSSKSKLRI